MTTLIVLIVVGVLVILTHMFSLVERGVSFIANWKVAFEDKKDTAPPAEIRKAGNTKITAGSNGGGDAVIQGGSQITAGTALNGADGGDLILGDGGPNGVGGDLILGPGIYSGGAAK